MSHKGSPKLTRHKRGILLFARLLINNTRLGIDRRVLEEKTLQILDSIPTCKGRGCDERSMAAAILFYTARWQGSSTKPSEIYKRVTESIDWLRIPRQSFHNSLNKLLLLLGHSSMFKRVLYGRIGAQICRYKNNPLIIWEAYGYTRGPPCKGVLETWPGPSPQSTLVWRAGMTGLHIKVGSVTFDAKIIVEKLYDFFDLDWFTAREAAVVLAVTPRTASALLRRLEEHGIVESRRPMQGKNMKEYRLARKGLGLEGT
ncbi:MAG: hypothetical protein GSR77_00075 [Desulfurococcales archaeon]|nr:hypothetical protein [Desulfurococcales archaeon]